MYPTYDTNPIALRHIDAERLEKLTRQADNAKPINLRAIGSVAVVLVAVVVFF